MRSGPLPPLLSATDVAEILGVSVQRVYELVRKDLVPSVKIGRNIRFSEQAIHEWIKSGGKGLSS